MGGEIISMAGKCRLFYSSRTGVKAEKGKEVQAKAEELADERVLDILIPPVRKTQPASIAQEGEEQLPAPFR